MYQYAAPNTQPNHFTRMLYDTKYETGPETIMSARSRWAPQPTPPVRAHWSRCSGSLSFEKCIRVLLYEHAYLVRMIYMCMI